MAETQPKLQPAFLRLLALAYTTLILSRESNFATHEHKEDFKEP